MFYFRVEGLFNWMGFNGRTARTNGSPVSRSYPRNDDGYNVRNTHTENTHNSTFTRFRKKLTRQQHKPVKSLIARRLNKLSNKRARVHGGKERGTQRRFPLSGHRSQDRAKEKHFVFAFKRTNFTDLLRRAAQTDRVNKQRNAKTRNYVKARFHALERRQRKRRNSKRSQRYATQLVACSVMGGK